MMKILLLGLFVCASVSAQTTQTVPVSGSVTITVPAPITGAPGAAGAPGIQGLPGANGTNGTNGTNGKDGVSPSAASVETALAADPNFVKAVAAAVGGTTPPPVCGAAPPSSSKTQACPTGTTGSWVQTTTFTAAPAPTCWTAVVAPTAAPAGACTPIPPPPPPTGATPTPTLLPFASAKSPPAIATMPAIAALPAGGSYVDAASGVKVYKATDANTPTAGNVGMAVTYSTQGLQISGPWGANSDQYTVFIHNGKGASYLFDYKLGGAFSNYRSIPAGEGAIAMSRKTPQIAYYLSGGNLHRYDTSKNAAADSAPFSLAFSTASGDKSWLMVNQDDTWASAVATDGQSVTALDMVGGKQITVANSGLDEVYIGYSSQALINDDAGGKAATAGYVYNFLTNSKASINLPFGQYPLVSHVPSLNGFWIATDNWTGGGHMPLDQIAYDGTHSSPTSTKADAAGGKAYYGQFHASGHWSQPAGQKQYVLYSFDHDTNAADTPNLKYGMHFADVSTGILYLLAYHNSEDATTNMAHTVGGSNYWSQAHASESNDGKVVIWNSNLQDTSREDVYLAEVPRS